MTFLDGYDAQSMYKEVHVLRNSRLNVSVAEPKPGSKGGEYRGGGGGGGGAAASYQTSYTSASTPTHVYAYSLVPTSTPSATYLPAAQYYAYQSSGTSQPGSAYFGSTTSQYHKDYN